MSSIKNKRKIVIKHILIISFVGIIILLLNISKIGCPIRLITGFPCPTCGLTRSVISLLKLDFKAAFRYNPMTLFIILAVMLGIHRDVIPINKKITDVLVIAMAILIFAVYIIRLSKGCLYV